MANGNIVGVEPLPALGAYRAKLADGSSMMLTGPTGESIYKRYGQNALGPNALASNDAPADANTASDVAGAVGKGMLYTNPLTAPLALTYDAGKRLLGGSEPKPRMGTTTVDAPQTTPETQQASAVAAQQGSPAAPAPASAAPPAGPTPLGYQMEGINPATGQKISGPAIRDADGSIKIYVPGVAGSAGGLTKFGKEAVKRHEDALAEEAKQHEIEKQATEDATKLAIQEAEKRAAYLDEQKAQAELQVQQQQDEQAKVQARVGELQGKYDKARDDFMSSKVDPDEYMKSGGGATAIFSTLGMMLGAFGATLGRTPNFAQEFVQSQIERHIRAQEAAINVKGKAADNMLADLTRETGSLQNGKLAMRQLLLEKSAVESQRIEASTKAPLIAANARKTAAQFAAAASQAGEARAQGFLQSVLTNPNLYQRGSAGRSAGFVQPTQESYEKGAENARQNEELRLKQEKEAAAPKIAGLKGTSNTSYDAAQTVKIAGNNIQHKYKDAGVDFSKDVPLVNADLYKWALANPGKAQQLKVDLKIMAKEGVRALTGGVPDSESLKHIDGMSLNQLIRENKNHLENSSEKLEMLEHKAREGIQAPDDNETGQ